MPIPVVYDASACRLERWFKQILFAGIGGLVALAAIIALGSQFDWIAPYVPYELFRISAHVVVVAWLLILVLFLFGPAQGVLRVNGTRGGVVSSLRWLARWSAAFFIDFVVVAVVLSLLLT